MVHELCLNEAVKKKKKKKEVSEGKLINRNGQYICLLYYFLYFAIVRIFYIKNTIIFKE